MVPRRQTSGRPSISMPQVTASRLPCLSRRKAGTDRKKNPIMPAISSGLRPTRSLRRPMKVMMTIRTAITQIRMIRPCASLYLSWSVRYVGMYESSM